MGVDSRVVSHRPNVQKSPQQKYSQSLAKVNPAR
jgi:hypothetical protein